MMIPEKPYSRKDIHDWCKYNVHHTNRVCFIRPWYDANDNIRVDKRHNQWLYVAKIDLVDLFSPHKKDDVIKVIQDGFKNYIDNYELHKDALYVIGIRKEEAQIIADDASVAEGLFLDIQDKYASKKNRILNKVSKNSEKYIQKLTELVEALPSWTQILMLESKDIFQTRSGWRTIGYTPELNPVGKLELPKFFKKLEPAVNREFDKIKTSDVLRNVLNVLKLPLSLLFRTGVAGRYNPESRRILGHEGEVGLVSFADRNVPTAMNRIYNIWSQDTDGIMLRQIGKSINRQYFKDKGKRASELDKFEEARKVSNLDHAVNSGTGYARMMLYSNVYPFIASYVEAHTGHSEIALKAVSILFSNAIAASIYKGAGNEVLYHTSASPFFSNKELSNMVFSDIFRIYSKSFIRHNGDLEKVDNDMDKNYKDINDALKLQVIPELKKLAEEKYANRKNNLHIAV